MFETLEADIVIMQEAKIQRKDLTDDMVLVPGWDVFFSLPRDKKGKSLMFACCIRSFLTVHIRVFGRGYLHADFEMLPNPRRRRHHRCAMPC